MSAVAFAALNLTSSPARAIDTDPLDFVAPPPGVSVLALYYGGWKSDRQYSHDAKVAENDIDLNYGVLTSIKFYDVGGYTFGTKIVLPVSDLSVATPSGTLSGSGFGDPTFVFPFWLVNKPASRTYFGLIPRFQVPLGDYDRNRPSAGANRYTYALQAGLSTGLSKDVTLDVVGDVQTFGDNNDILGGGHLEQDALYSLQTHLTYDILPGLSASIGGYWYFGGETKVRGVSNDDRTNTTTIIGSLGYWLSKSDNLLVQYRTDTEVENGAKFQGVQARYLRVF